MTQKEDEVLEEQQYRSALGTYSKGWPSQKILKTQQGKEFAALFFIELVTPCFLAVIALNNANISSFFN